MSLPLKIASLLAVAAPVLAQDNTLILLTDDVGIDQLPAYGLGSDLPPTPNLDALAAEGVLFRNAYSAPVCSPSRVQVLTGRQPHRHMIGHIVGPGMVSPEFFQMPLDEVTLPELLEQGAPGLFSTAAIGKWHLYDGPGFEFAPNEAGFQHFSGTPTNLGFDPIGFYNWLKLVNGTFFVVLDTYATTDQVDDALAWIATVPEPWLCYIAFSAAHVPFHEPPDALHTQDLSSVGPPSVEPRPYYKATVEALDTEIGRLLDGLGAMRDRTNVFFAADNGSPFEVVVPPFDPDNAKTTLYDGGCHVPLIVSGPAVGQPGECDGLVELTDVFATVAELSGIDPGDVLPPGRLLDSVSLRPYLDDPTTPSLRATAFSQTFSPIGSAPYNVEGYMLRDERYKLIRVFTEGLPGFPVEFYDLEVDPHEQNNLLSGGLTAAELDVYRFLDRAGRDTLRAAEVTAPAGSEEHVVLGVNSEGAGGVAESGNFRATSQIGLAAGGQHVSTTRVSQGGASWLTGGIQSDHPLVFGFSDPRGDPAGGEARSLFGFGLNGLVTSSVLEVELGGVDVGGVSVLSDTHAQVTTPPGQNQHTNPAGVETLWMRTDAGQLLAHRAFAYLPAIDVLEPPRVGGPFRMRIAVEPGDVFQVLWGQAIPGLAVPTAPLGGAFELLAKANKLTPVLVASEEEIVVNGAIPELPALVGLMLDLQGAAAQVTPSLGGSWTNRLRVTVGPQQN